MEARQYVPISLADVSSYIQHQPADARLAFRLCLEFLDEYRAEPRAARARLLATDPPPTGSKRWDAFLGALAEHLAFHDRLTVPGWAQMPDRFLDSSWFLLDLPSVRPSAIAESPAAFRRRAIWITAEALDRV
ncbi:MAG TPA: hypothetical protein VIN56_09810 [Candidatus Dormibacteraeota bacterium]|jgi:hypothetical protein